MKNRVSGGPQLAAVLGLALLVRPPLLFPSQARADCSETGDVPFTLNVTGLAVQVNSAGRLFCNGPWSRTSANLTIQGNISAARSTGPARRSSRSTASGNAGSSARTPSPSRTSA